MEVSLAGREQRGHISSAHRKRKEERGRDRRREGEREEENRKQGQTIILKPTPL